MKGTTEKMMVNIIISKKMRISLRVLIMKDIH